MFQPSNPFLSTSSFSSVPYTGRPTRYPSSFQSILASTAAARAPPPRPVNSEPVMVDIDKINRRWAELRSQTADIQTALVTNEAAISELKLKQNNSRDLLGSVMSLTRDSDAIAHASALCEHLDKVTRDELSSMLDKQRELREDLSRAATLKQALIGMATSLAPEMRDTTTCPVCITRTVDIVFVPCGHTVCSECSVRIPIRCHYCRHLVERKQRFYLSGQGPIPAVQQTLEALIQTGSSADASGGVDFIH